jgi:hypothetical protein
MREGARPQTAKTIRTFGGALTNVMINNSQYIADYIAVLEHDGGKGYLGHWKKGAVSRSPRDMY